jgi:hypothetical protein
MKRKKYLAVLAAVSLAFVMGSYLGAWSERNDWRDARACVEKDLVRRGLDPQYLGPTEIVENPGQELTYGFAYNHQDTHVDYVLRFGGPRGLEMSTWDHARDDKR